MDNSRLEVAPTSLTPLMARRAVAEGDRKDVFHLRMLLPTDTEALAGYFNSLSERTKSLFGPHAFTDEEALRITSNLGSDELLRYVVLSGSRMIGYFLLLPGVTESDGARYRGYDIDLTATATYAPSVCDEFHGRGIGTAAFAVIRNAAESAGVRRIVLMGGVQARNSVARAYYRRLGFREVGRFQTRVDNYDMMLDIY